MGENITECEQDYQTAIWMLEAILQVRPSDEINIEEEDRRIINKCKYHKFFILHIKTNLIYKNSYRFYSSSDNCFAEKNGIIGTCIICKATPMKIPNLISF